jgi:hypothetical protein
VQQQGDSDGHSSALESDQRRGRVGGVVMRRVCGHGEEGKPARAQSEPRPLPPAQADPKPCLRRQRQ